MKNFTQRFCEPTTGHIRIMCESVFYGTWLAGCSHTGTNQPIMFSKNTPSKRNSKYSPDSSSAVTILASSHARHWRSEHTCDERTRVHFVIDCGVDVHAMSNDDANSNSLRCEWVRFVSVLSVKYTLCSNRQLPHTVQEPTNSTRLCWTFMHVTSW